VTRKDDDDDDDDNNNNNNNNNNNGIILSVIYYPVMSAKPHKAKATCPVSTLMTTRTGWQYHLGRRRYPD
jgi:hypothetical protein